MAPVINMHLTRVSDSPSTGIDEDKETGESRITNGLFTRETLNHDGFEAEDQSSHSAGEF
jgi:hypothetical protein